CSAGCRCFFFSSRRRHTRSKRDWSSDVCSSDLGHPEVDRHQQIELGLRRLLRPADGLRAVPRLGLLSGDGMVGAQQVLEEVLAALGGGTEQVGAPQRDRKSTRLNSSHVSISYAVFCLKKKN